MSRLLRRLLRLYPVGLRSRYGDEMVEVIVARARAIRAQRGRIAALRFWVFQLLDLVRSAFHDRRASGQLPGGGLDHDLRIAARRLRRAPGFALVVIVALAVGIGGTTAIFALVDAVLLEPLPYPDQDRLVYVGIGSPQTDVMALTAGALLSIEEDDDLFEAFGAWVPRQVAVQWPDGPRQHRVVHTTAGLFTALGVVPEIGRLFDDRDTRPGRPATAVLDHGFWQRQLGGDEDVVGRALRIDGAEVTVIGVLPSGFRFLDVDADLYLPLHVDKADAGVLSFDFRGIGRLRPGASSREAAQRISALLPASAQRYGWIDAGRLDSWELRGAVGPLKRVVVGGAGAFLWILLGAVAVVLLIACADVANLFLVRAQDRKQEIAARMALGASRGRVFRETLVESLLLALLGGLAGTLVAAAGTRWLLALTPGRLPRAAGMAFDARVAAFTVVLCLAVAVGLALLSSVGLGDVTATLRHGRRTASDSRLARRLRDALAMAEIALALVLLVASGLMIRSFDKLRNVEPGVAEPGRVLTLSIAIPRTEVPDNDDTLALFRRIDDRLAALPGVDAVGAAVKAPTLGGNHTPVHTEDDPDAEHPLNALRKGIVGEYRKAAGIPLLAGRDLNWDDVIERRPVGLVSEGLARALWGGPEAALGKRIRHLPGDAWREVVGVVGDVREAGLDRPAPPVVYWPAAVRDFYGFAELIERELTFTIRSAGPEPLQLLPAAREAVWAEAPAVPISGAATLDELLAASIERTSFILVALGLAAAIATLLGAIGIYGVIAYLFARRGKELGIRVALGARAGDVRALILRHAGRLAAAGLGAGVPAAVLSSRLLRGYLYGIRGTDPLAYLAAAALVLAIAALACVIPVRRALALDPADALRAE